MLEILGSFGQNLRMRLFRSIFICLLLGMLPSCDMKKERNTAPKPPPAPAPKKKVVIQKEEVKETVAQKIDEPSVLEWEGGDFTVSNSFRDADIILVMLYTDWCHFCKSLSPLLEGMTMREDKKIKVLRVNADLFPEIGQKFNLVAVPKVLIFKQGAQIGEFVGAISEDKLTTIIRNVSGENELKVE